MSQLSTSSAEQRNFRSLTVLIKGTDWCWKCTVHSLWGTAYANRSVLRGCSPSLGYGENSAHVVECWALSYFPLLHNLNCMAKGEYMSLGTSRTVLYGRGAASLALMVFTCTLYHCSASPVHRCSTNISSLEVCRRAKFLPVWGAAHCLSVQLTDIRQALSSWGLSRRGGKAGWSHPSQDKHYEENCTTVSVTLLYYFYPSSFRTPGLLPLVY